ncbi:OmpH family outer membrane protein [Flavihumibacter rivuli]|uniref:OmpH family outer membrane protein n=1 Tax=Flavihumibacter rivuli TaxID=2838156 RepID=UPI001BDE9687|nr:OmpH family outer membrane protein [Flavihumibacter rivuli]ULQ58127.1 OmpH family outer membrane protein [Flavihumibacter rivuli]
MKQLSLVLSVVAVLASGVAIFKSIGGDKKSQDQASTKTETAAEDKQFTIAYFDIDSLQGKYEYFKDALAQLKVKEEAMNNELSALERSYQKKIGEWQQKGATMSQAEADAVQREYAQMQQNYQQRRITLEQQLENLKMDYKKNIKTKIEAYLKEFNKSRGYSYIISYEPELMFYKDTIYNITDDLIEGLNKEYKKK